MEFIKKFYASSLIFEARDLTLDEIGVTMYKRELALALRREENIKDIILKFKDVGLKDSHSLGALLFARRYTKGNDGTCTLINPNPKTISLLKQSKLEKAFTVISDDAVYDNLVKKLRNKEEKNGIPDRNVEEKLNKNEDDNSSDKYPVDGDFKFFE